MPNLISPQESVLLQQETNYLNAGIPVYGSRVLFWPDSSRPLLVYHSATQGFIVSDISDLPSSTINELATVSEVHGFWYYIPQEAAGVVKDAAEWALSAAKQAGATIDEAATEAARRMAEALAAMLRPVAKELALPLIVGIALAVIYLMKK